MTSISRCEWAFVALISLYFFIPAVFILLNIIFRDIHQFVLQSHLEMLLTGYYNDTLITEDLMLMGGLFALVPISMVLLSLLLQRRWLRPVSAFGVIFTAGPALMARPTGMDDVLHLGAAFCALAAISWIARRWRADLSDPAHP